MTIPKEGLFPEKRPSIGIYVLNSLFYSFAAKGMDLVTCMTVFLALGTYLNGVVTLEECTETGQGQSPEIKVGISFRKPGLPASHKAVSLNEHLQPNPKNKPLPRGNGTSPKFLEE